uniref:Medium-chain acyl-CoA ligase ACSF2, mitochondrial n=2 Tax=Timema TaxID=61471 RepID=A0A7R9DH35_TIMPO|nr:unnamed protein product [Timema poppensis]
MSEGRCLFVGWKPSYHHNPGTEPLSPLTIGQMVDKSVEKFGDNEALVSVQQGHRITFQQVREKADRLAAGLLEIGLQPGDRLGLWSTNCSEWYITSFAAARAGLTLVNINPAYQSPELRYCINKVGLKALVMADTSKTQNFHQILSQVSPELGKARPGRLNSESVPSLKSVIVMTDQHLPGVFQYEDIMDAGSKESIISHHTLVNNSFYIGKRMNLKHKQHRICLPLPLFHVFGSVVGVLTAMQFGATLVLPSPSVSADFTLRAIQQEKVTVSIDSPLRITVSIDSPLRVTVSIDSPLRVTVSIDSPLRVTVSIDSPLRVTVNIDSPLRVTVSIDSPLRITRASVFGMTETGPLTFQVLPDDPMDKVTKTVGCVSEHIEVKLVDPEGNMVPMGSPGELLVRGYCNMLEYWGDEDKTRSTLGRDRWLRTGGWWGEYYPGTGGVFGVDDVRLGEVVACSLRLKEGSALTQEDIRAYCKGMTSSGKIQKFKLKEEITKELESQKSFGENNSLLSPTTGAGENRK